MFLNCYIYAQDSARTLNDSAVDIYKETPSKAIEILQRALKIAELNKNNLEIGRSKNYQALVYNDLGEYEKALALSKEALSISNDSILMASSYNNIGRCNRQLGNYQVALENYLKALTIYEVKNNLNEKARVINNIGMVYSYLGVPEKAIEYHLKAKSVFEELNDRKGISEVYNNIAIIYANDGDLEKALSHFKHSLAIEKNLNDKKGIAESANNVGAVYYYMQKIDSALVYFNTSVDIERRIGNYAGVGASYNNIAQVLIESDRVADSKIYIDSAYYYANQSKTAVDIETALLNYSQYYEAKKDTKSALRFFKDYSVFKDSTLNIETTSKIAQLEIEFETEKKEKEILTQRADIAEKELSLSKKNYYILGLLALALILSLLGYLLYSQQKLKNRQLKKENQLKDALVKIETQSRLQNQRLRISRDLHDNIGAQLTFIISSLDNLKYGFKLPEKLNDKLKNISEFTTTTIYELRDTIWAMNKSEISFEDLQTRISNFIDKANIASHNIAFNFNVKDDIIKNKQFTSVIGMNVYRIIQEALNNAIKYAEASVISVNIYDAESKLNIVVEDNGKGFNLNLVSLGNGLNNIKKRAQDIGASVTINSELKKGTKIHLSI